MMLATGDELMNASEPCVVACDFDGTLCEAAYPGIGRPNMRMIELIKQLKQKGHKVILNTCRVGDRLQEAVSWCRGYGIEFDAVNENLKERIELYGGDCRKISADYYFEDRSVSVVW